MFYVQIVLAVLLIALILMQTSEAGLGAAFGGGENDTLHRTRRGAELFLLRVAILVGILFVASVAYPLFI